MISAMVVLASKPKSRRNKKLLVTYELEYPRFIHAEFMTHRRVSRADDCCSVSASSSRATPVREVLRRVVRDPAVPIEWGANQKGQKAPRQLSGWRRSLARRIWLAARWPAVVLAWLMLRLGLAKQVANRLLEPWAHTRVVVTATEWDNFFALRCHRAAQPEMRRLAEAMYVALIECVAAGEVQVLRPGEWHLPYVREYITALQAAGFVVDPSWGEWKPISVALCARVSVLKPGDGKLPTVEENLALYERLVGSDPKHASPAEHQATPGRGSKSQSGNLFGWVQLRQTLPEEHASKFDPDKAEWTDWARERLSKLPGFAYLAPGMLVPDPKEFFKP